MCGTKGCTSIAAGAYILAKGARRPCCARCASQIGAEWDRAHAITQTNPRVVEDAASILRKAAL